MCDIGDASRGSLSSYAYTLMVLFFLQQRNPPVIPVLQEVQTASFAFLNKLDVAGFFKKKKSLLLFSQKLDLYRMKQ